MSRTLELILDASGDSESCPYEFDFVHLLADLDAVNGGTWTITGTPDIDVSPDDTFLTIGSPVVNTAGTAVQAVISANNVQAAVVGTYRLTCRATCTDGTSTATRICRGQLSVSRWS